MGLEAIESLSWVRDDAGAEICDHLDLQQHPSSGGDRPKPAPPFDCNQFSMMFFKVLPCLKVAALNINRLEQQRNWPVCCAAPLHNNWSGAQKYNHDWTACPGAHPGERARRRCLLVYRYGAKVCPDMQTRGICPRGESCYMTHGMFEYYMHPLKYKTKMCKSGPTCRRHYCFFSHSPEELRESSSIPEDWQLQVLPDGSISSSSAAKVLSCLPAEARGSAQAAIAQLPQIMHMFENGDRGMQQMVQMQMQPGMGMQGQAAWGSASAASSGSHYDSGPVLLAQPEVQYGSPSLMAAAPQHAYNPLPQQDMLQYGPACGLPSGNSQQGMGGMQVVAQPARSGQHSMLPAPQQQMGAHVPDAPYMQASIAQAQPVSGFSSCGWPAGGGGAQAVPYGAGNSAAMPVNPPMLQANVLAPAQAGMFLQAVPGSYQQQPYQQAPAGAPLVAQQQQQQPSDVSASVMQLPQQQQSASVPLANTMLMQPQMLPGGMPPQAGLACLPQQPTTSATSDQLVQQLQALGLNTVAMSQRL